MVDTQPVDLAFAKELQNEFVSLVENCSVFLAQSREIINVKKTAIVDVIGGDPPESQAIGLGFDEFVEFIEGSGISWRTVHASDISSDEANHRDRTLTQDG